MRRVKSQYWEKGQWNQVEGLFHGWAIDSCEDFDQAFGITVGLIEDAGGYIRKVDPGQMQFMKRSIILPRPGKWSSCAGVFLIWERIENTIWCRVRKRYNTWFGYFRKG